MALHRFLTVLIFFLTTTNGMEKVNTFKQAAFFQAIINKEIAKIVYSGDYSFKNANSNLLVTGLQCIQNSLNMPKELTANRTSCIVIDNCSKSATNTFSLSGYSDPQKLTSSSNHGVGTPIFGRMSWLPPSLAAYKSKGFLYPEKIMEIRSKMIGYEINHAINALRRFESNCKNIKSSVDFINAIRELKDLSKLTISVPWFNNFLKETVNKLQKETSTANGFLKPITTNAKKVADIIDNFQQRTIKWCHDYNDSLWDMGCKAIDWIDGDHGIISQCYCDVQKFWDLYGEQLKNKPAHDIVYAGPWGWEFTEIAPSPYDAQFQQKIAENPQSKAFLTLAKLASEKDWQKIESFALETKNSPGYSKEFQKFYSEIFNHNFNDQRLNKNLIRENDPFCQQSLKELPRLKPNDIMPTAHPVNQKLAERVEIYDTLMQKLGIESPSKEIQTVLYNLVDVLQKNDPQEFVNILISQLSCDHADPAIRNLYNKIHTDGLCNLLTYNNPATTIRMSEQIGLKRYEKERTLLFNLATCSIDSPAKETHVTTALNYLKQGIGNDPLAKEYLTLAHATGNALLSPEGNQAVLNLADYSQVPTNDQQRIIHTAATKIIADNLEVISENDNSELCANSTNFKALEKIDAAYKAMLEGNLLAQDYLDQVLLYGSANETSLNIDFGGPSQSCIQIDAELKKLAREAIYSNTVSKEFQQLFTKDFFNNFTDQGFDKYLVRENDPFYQKLKNELPSQRLENIPTACAYNQQLVQRNSIYDNIVKKFAIENLSKEVQAVLYTWVDKIQNNNCHDLGKLIVSQLSSDHAELAIRDLYNKVHTDGLCNLFTYNNPGTTIKIGEQIGLQKHEKERALLYNLATCTIASPAKEALVTTALNYLKQGISNDPLAKEYLTLAHATGNALLSPGANRAVLNLADYSKAPIDPQQKAIHAEVTKIIADNLEAILAGKSSPSSKLTGIQAIRKVDAAYKAMRQGNPQAQDYLERALLVNGVNQNVLSVDFDKQAELFKEMGVDRVVNEIARMKTTNENLQQYGIKICKEIEIDYKITQFMVENNLTLERYTQFYGNELQHKIHDGTIKIIYATYDLVKNRSIERLDKFMLDNIKDTVLQTNDLALSHNVVGDVQQAAVLSNFCWQIIDFAERAVNLSGEIGLAAGRGIISGVQEKAIDLYHIASDPVGAAKGLVTSLGNLCVVGQQLVEQNRKMHELLLASPMKTPFPALIEMNKQSSELFNSVIDFAKREGITGIVEKSAHLGTTTALDTVLISKGATVLNKVAKVASSSKMGEFLQKITNAANATEIEAVTAEGISAKVAQNAENSLLSEARDASVASVRREQILPKFDTYEQARNKALEIIGDVNPHSAMPIIGKQGVCKGKIVGQQWCNGKVTLRIDHDLLKGPHINITDFRVAKGLDGIAIAIPFNGDAQTINSLLKHLNTPASLSAAKAILQKNGKLDYFNKLIGN